MFHQGDGPVHQVRRRETLRHHVARLHQLESELLRVGVVQAAAHGHRPGHKHVPLHNLADPFFESPARPPSTAESGAAPRARHRHPSAYASKYSASNWQVYVLVAATLSSLPARTSKVWAEISAMVLLRFVGDPQGRGAAAARVGQHRVGVGRLTGLGDPHHQRVPQVHRAGVERQNRWRRQRHRNVGRDLDEIPAKLRGIVRSSSRHQDHQPRPVGFEVAAQVPQRFVCFFQRLCQRLRLLTGLFQHSRHGAQVRLCDTLRFACPVPNGCAAVTSGFVTRTERICFQGGWPQAADLLESDQKSRYIE